MTDSSTPSSVKRRTLIKGAAWSVPVVAAAIAVPAHAASVAGCTPGQKSFTVPSATDAAGGLENWTVPAGVTAVSYVVTGGAGGWASHLLGGHGARVIGTLAVTPGDVLTINIGQGGLGGGSQNTGGGGFGTGGSTTISPVPAYRLLGGGGGGASAIVFNGAPLVVAGGGGGAGTLGWIYGTWPTGGVGGDAGTDGGAVSADGFVAGGGHADGTGGVASGPYQETTAGQAASGHNGADGVVTGRLGANRTDVEYIGTGAGGGGYTGGGSGAIAYIDDNATDVHNYGGAGAGGASYVASGVAGTIDNSGGAASVAGVRTAGSVTLSWSC